MVDKIKLVVALAFVVAGVGGFYYLAESPTLYRLAALLGGILVGAVVAWFTQPGKEFFAFAQDSWAEVKKVVWPSREETLRMTGLVFVFVVVMAVFLWVTDKSLEVVLYDWVLGWKKA